MTIWGVPVEEAAAVVGIVGTIVGLILGVVGKQKRILVGAAIVVVVAIAVVVLVKISPDDSNQEQVLSTPVQSPELSEPSGTEGDPSPSRCPDKSLDEIIAEANDLFSKVWDEWAWYDAVNTSEHNYYVDDGDLKWIIDRSERWEEYYYLDGDIRFILIKENKYSNEALRLYLYCGELVRLINYEKEYIYADDNSDEFEDMKIYASKAASAYSDAMSYIQRFEPEVLE